MVSQSTYSQSKLVIFTVILLSLINYSFINATWTEPPVGTPPANNIEAPINVGLVYQVKTGDLGAMKMRAGEYCDVTGANCTKSGVPNIHEVGSLVFAVIGPSAPIPTFNSAIPSTALTYGESIAGRHLCPAGLGLFDTNDNDKISMVQSTNGGNNPIVCEVALTGTYRSLGYVQGKSTTLSSMQQSTRATLFQKISNI